jgi:hypothetical protein
LGNLEISLKKIMSQVVSLSALLRRVSESTNSEGGNFAMASLSYYQGGEWTNFPYSSEPRKPRIKAQGLEKRKKPQSLKVSPFMGFFLIFPKIVG